MKLRNFFLALPLFAWSLIGLGAASNEAVLIANHGVFPVMANEAQLATMREMQAVVNKIMNVDTPTKANNGPEMLDDVHAVMSKDSHLKALSDIIDVRGVGIMSVGDLLLDAGNWIWGVLSTNWLLFYSAAILLFDVELGKRSTR